MVVVFVRDALEDVVPASIRDVRDYGVRRFIVKLNDCPRKGLTVLAGDAAGDTTKPILILGAQARRNGKQADADDDSDQVTIEAIGASGFEGDGNQLPPAVMIV
jgi:hypothetical protein